MWQAVDKLGRWNLTAYPPPPRFSLEEASCEEQSELNKMINVTMILNKPYPKQVVLMKYVVKQRGLTGPSP